MKNSAVRNFAKAALFAGGTLLAAATGAANAQQQPQPRPTGDPVTIMNNSPACLAFNHPDRNGVKFSQPELHRYDDVLRAFNKAISSYSGFSELRARLEKLNRPLNGICVYSHQTDAPIVPDTEIGSVDLNIFKETPWGPGLADPDHIKRNLDALVHVTTMMLAGNLAAAGLSVPALDPNVSAFIHAVTMANGHIEATLSTLERGLAENRLTEITPLLINEKAPFANEAALLLQKAMTKGTLSAEDRAGFRTAVIQSALKNPALRAGSFEAISGQMQELAKNGVNVSKLYMLVPPAEAVAKRLEQHLGALANTMIDGKPMLQAYLEHWAGNANDPVAELSEQFAQFRAYVGMMHEQAAQEKQKPQNDKPAPAPQIQPAPKP